MKKAWNLFSYLFVFGGIIIFYWSGYSMANEIVFFAEHGFEKQVEILRLERATAGYRTLPLYQYLIEMDGREIRKCFYIRLPIGKNISVLVSPENSEELILGNKENNIFELFFFTSEER
jgi:hypothetical protein